MASELSDCPVFTSDFFSVSYNTENKKQPNGNGFNETKFKILSAVKYLNARKHRAYLGRICVLTGLSSNQVKSRISRYKGYLTQYDDPNRLKRRHKYYRLHEVGMRKLDKMLDRMDNGLDLKLQKLPEKKDYSNFVLLPGIKEYEQMRKEGKI